MDYSSTHKPIYLQIADKMSERILSGEWKPEDRIPSVREMGVAMGVNPNTVARTYEYMEQSGAIYNRRGIGFFVSPEGRDVVLGQMKEEFFANEIPGIRKKVEMLGITPEEMTVLLFR